MKREQNITLDIAENFFASFLFGSEKRRSVTAFVVERSDDGEREQDALGFFKLRYVTFTVVVVRPPIVFQARRFAKLTND